VPKSLEQRLVLNEGKNIRLGNTFITTPQGYTAIPEEILKYTARHTDSKTLVFETQDKSVKYTISYDDKAKANLIIRGISRPIKVNKNGSLRIDLNADQARIANRTVLEDQLITDFEHEITDFDYFIAKSETQFSLYQYLGAVTLNPTQKEISFMNITKDLLESLILNEDKLGEYINNGVSLNDQEYEYRVELNPIGNIKISGIYGAELERIINSDPITNEGTRIKQGEKFIISDKPAGSPTAQIFEYTSIVPGNYAVFNKVTNGTPQTIQVSFTSGEGYLLNSGSSYLVKENNDQTISIDLDASGTISKNKETLTGKLVTEENREIIQGQDYFIINESGKPVPYSISSIDTTNHKVEFKNHSTSATITETYDSITKKGNLNSEYIFQVDETGSIKLDMNKDGKIE